MVAFVKARLERRKAIPIFWMIVIIALCVVVLFETVLLLLLLRALGKLKQQGNLSSEHGIFPFAERGLALGTSAPDFAASAHDGRSIRLNDSVGHWRILAFLSPGCPACEETIKTLNSVREERPELIMLVIGGVAKAANDAYALEQSAMMPILTPDATLAKEIYLVQEVPFVYILDESAIIRAKGVVNGLEHLQQLLVSADVPASLLRLGS